MKNISSPTCPCTITYSRGSMIAGTSASTMPTVQLAKTFWKMSTPRMSGFFLFIASCTRIFSGSSLKSVASSVWWPHAHRYS